jgi:DNA-nicking Smr family endonuclease
MLSGDELDVWDHVAESVKPVRVKRRVPLHEDMTEPSAAAPMPPRTPPKMQPVLETRPATPRPAAIEPRVVTSPQLSEFDARRARKLGRGQMEIDARIDLHGDRQSEAHGRLRAFLLRCHADGKRVVLVITGKGRDTDDADPAFDIGYERRERGVLKRNLPRWLAEPELRAIVVSYTTAHVRHGGEGAFYIHLRRAR